MRADVKDRAYRVYTYQAVDRVPDIEFGYWPQTVRRWLQEGLPLTLTRAEVNRTYHGKVDRFFGFDEGFTDDLGVNYMMHPTFPEEILERKAGSVIMRDAGGVVAECFTGETDDASIPHYLDFPVKTPDDWRRLKTERYRLDDPVRRPPPEREARLRRAAAEGRMIVFSTSGFYGILRAWMGVENLSLAFYDYPAMIRDMVEHWAELIARQIEALPPEIPIDYAFWWEDMASKNGPLVSPAQFRAFIQPGYRRVMTVARKRGCELGAVDSDGNPRELIPGWLEEGINIMLPLEIEAGVDPFAWRREFGRAVRLRGGIAKAPLVQGGAAIARELERIQPLLEQGGYIPHIDHGAPPDIPYAHYCDYLEKKRRLIGKG